MEIQLTPHIQFYTMSKSKYKYYFCRKYGFDEKDISDLSDSIVALIESNLLKQEWLAYSIIDAAYDMYDAAEECSAAINTPSFQQKQNNYKATVIRLFAMLDSDKLLYS